MPTKETLEVVSIDNTPWIMAWRSPVGRQHALQASVSISKRAISHLFKVLAAVGMKVEPLDW